MKPERNFKYGKGQWLRAEAGRRLWVERMVPVGHGDPLKSGRHSGDLRCERERAGT